jgi:hypothetical protein
MKKIVLFVALGVPILVFIFLKMFGKNEFEVPVFYAEGVHRTIPGCNPWPTPYVLPDSTLNAWGWTGAKATLIIVNEKGIEKNLTRIADLFEPGDYATVKIPVASYDVATCMLLAGDSSRVVMIDDKKRIRGYYTPTTGKERDRLAVEIRILLKQY